MRLVILALLALVTAACAAPLAGRGAATPASSSAWWLCDPPALWEDRR